MFRIILTQTLLTSFLLAGHSDIEKSSVDINKKPECTPHNKVITKKEKLQHQQCNVNKAIFSKYRAYVNYLNKMNREEKPISEYRDIPHPLTYIGQLEGDLESLDPRTGQYRTVTLNLNAMRIVYDNIDIYPVHPITSERATMSETKFGLGLSEEELWGLFKKNKELFRFSQRKKLRYDTNLYYTRALYLQKIIEERGGEGDLDLEKIEDFEKIKGEIYEKYLRKYSRYIYAKSNFNLQRKNLVNDDYAIFKEHASLLKKMQEIEAATNNPNDTEYLETRYKVESLASLITQIKFFPARAINSNNPRISEAIQGVLRKNYSYGQLEFLMFEHEKKRDSYKKYRNQYWFEYHHLQYGIYRHILRHQLYKRGFMEKVGDWFL